MRTVNDHGSPEHGWNSTRCRENGERHDKASNDERAREGQKDCRPSQKFARRLSLKVPHSGAAQFFQIFVLAKPLDGSRQPVLDINYRLPRQRRAGERDIRLPDCGMPAAAGRTRSVMTLRSDRGSARQVRELGIHADSRCSWARPGLSGGVERPLERGHRHSILSVSGCHPWRR